MACPSHVVCLFCVTAGQNGENLGSDEEQIVQFVYLLYDLTNNKVNGYDLNAMSSAHEHTRLEGKQAGLVYGGR